MAWQDLVMMIGGFGFAIALFPSIVGKSKPAVSSSLITGTILLVFCVCYASLALWLAFSSTLLTVVMWYILAVQKGKTRGEK